MTVLIAPATTVANLHDADSLLDGASTIFTGAVGRSRDLQLNGVRKLSCLSSTRADFLNHTDGVLDTPMQHVLTLVRRLFVAPPPSPFLSADNQMSNLQSCRRLFSTCMDIETTPAPAAIAAIPLRPTSLRRETCDVGFDCDFEGSPMYHRISPEVSSMD
ncbi:hypothetical protein BDZ89DRAFT_67318 [Hymenopellis radicata]|nr:hypothetical protein BDZ89DRAFT_67318 [Hymenopellis radicata]